jgi:L-aminopeptidase/D-esterase-like protein
VTAILPHDGDLFQEPVAAAVYTINGFGKVSGFEQVRELGTIEAPILLTNTVSDPTATAGGMLRFAGVCPDADQFPRHCLGAVCEECQSSHVRMASQS